MSQQLKSLSTSQKSKEKKRNSVPHAISPFSKKKKYAHSAIKRAVKRKKT